jgi:hypothetical protein
MVGPRRHHPSQPVLGKPLVPPMKTTWHAGRRLATGACVSAAVPSTMIALGRSRAAPRDMGHPGRFSPQPGPAIVGFHGLAHITGRGPLWSPTLYTRFNPFQIVYVSRTESKPPKLVEIHANVQKLQTKIWITPFGYIYPENLTNLPFSQYFVV